MVSNLLVTISGGVTKVFLIGPISAPGGNVPTGNFDTAIFSGPPSTVGLVNRRSNTGSTAVSSTGKAIAAGFAPSILGALGAGEPGEFGSAESPSVAPAGAIFVIRAHADCALPESAAPGAGGAAVPLAAHGTAAGGAVGVRTAETEVDADRAARAATLAVRAAAHGASACDAGCEATGATHPGDGPAGTVTNTGPESAFACCGTRRADG